MKRSTKIALALGAALSFGLAAGVVNAEPYGMGWGGNGPGWGGWHMGGNGPGWGGRMGGYGPGYGMGPGMRGGYGPGWGGHMGGYGPGYGMGPGMMGGYGPGWGGHMGGYGPGYGMGPQAMFGGYYGNTDRSLAALKARLGITAKQDGAWQAFAKNAKKQSESRQAWFARMQQAHSAGSAPELLAQRAELMKQRESELEANAAAMKNLYAALTPEQRAIADQSFGGYGPANCLQGYGGPGRRFR